MSHRTNNEPIGEQTDTGGASSEQEPTDAQYEWNRSALRELLTAAFTDGDLTALCYDHFPQVYDKFGEGMGKSAKVHLLLEHCVSHKEVETLLASVHEHNPAQYERFECGQLPAPATAEPHRESENLRVRDPASRAIKAEVESPPLAEHFHWLLKWGARQAGVQLLEAPRWMVIGHSFEDVIARLQIAVQPGSSVFYGQPEKATHHFWHPTAP